MATEHDVKLGIELRPVGQPRVKISVNGQEIDVQLQQLQKFDFEFRCSEAFELCVSHVDKPQFDIDTAVEITAIELWDIRDPKFIWAGTYWPDYPEHLTGLPEYYSSQAYLGWNGVYRLKIAVPVFTWIHQTLDLGWIYR